MNKSNHPMKHSKYKFKVVLIGPYGTGKTSVLSRLTSNYFDDDYHMTLKIASGSKIIQVGKQCSARLEIVDTLGSGFSNSNFSSSVQDSDAIILFYDITNEGSFHTLNNWLKQIKLLTRKEVLYVLAGTHLDQPYKREVSFSEGMKWKKRNEFPLFFEISSKTSENVTQMFEQTTKHLLMKQTSKQKFDNPEISTTFEDERSLSLNNSKITVLQKKLLMKQHECATLWIDYEQALQKLYVLQIKWKQDQHEVLNQIKDSEQLQQKIKQLQNNMLVVENYYSNKQESMEEQYIKKINTQKQEAERLLLDNLKLRQQINELWELVNFIQQSLQERQQELKAIITERQTSIIKLEDQKKKLINEKQLLIFEKLMLQKEYEIEVERRINKEQQYTVLKIISQGQVIRINQQVSQIQRLNFLKDQSYLIIQQYQQSLIHFRQEQQIKNKLEVELQFQQDKYLKMEISYKDIIAQMRNEYLALLQNHHRQKQEIIQSKQHFVNKIMQSKVSQINVIKTFIQDLDMRKQANHESEGLLKKFPVNSKSNSGQTESSSSQNSKPFLEIFVGIVKQQSRFMLTNLQKLLETFQDIKDSCFQLREHTEKLDLTEILYDWKQNNDSQDQQNYSAVSHLKYEQFKIWQILNSETQRRISGVVASIDDIIDSIGQNNDDFKLNIQHICESISKLQGITDKGIQQYIDQLQN